MSCTVRRRCLIALLLPLGLVGWVRGQARPLLLVSSLVVVPAADAAAQPAPAAVAALHADLARQLAAHDRGGRWRSPDSSFLAWSCGQQLAAMVDLFEATGDRKWLDQLVRYADAVLANLTRNRDGFLSWRSRLYSSFRVGVAPAAGHESSAAVEPADVWVRRLPPWMREMLVGEATGSAAPADWEYRLTWRAGPKVEVKGATTGKLIATVAVRDGRFQPLPGVTLTVRGQPAPGDAFVLTAERPKDFDSAVHDGVILTPICRFIALVRAEPALRTAYGPKAEAYLKVIESDLIPKWKPYWRNWRAGGLLVGPEDEAVSYPGISLPHNQYLALGQTLVRLHRITRKQAYRDQAEKMARFFKSCLRPVGNRYEWNYWDATGEWDKPWDRPEEKRAEDTGHGSLDIGFVLACAEAGIVFTEADLKPFADTFLTVMWNGSLDAPTVGGYVNTSKSTRQSGNLQQWVLLSRIDPKVRQVCQRLIPAAGSLHAKAQLHLLWAAGRRTPP